MRFESFSPAATLIGLLIPESVDDVPGTVYVDQECRIVAMCYVQNHRLPSGIVLDQLYFLPSCVMIQILLMFSASPQ